MGTWYLLFSLFLGAGNMSMLAACSVECSLGPPTAFLYIYYFHSLQLKLGVEILSLFFLTWFLKKRLFLPWLVWLSGLSTGLQTKGSLVWFPAGAHAWVTRAWSPVEGAWEPSTHWCSSPSLSSTLPLCLKINKILEKGLFSIFF